MTNEFLRSRLANVIRCEPQLRFLFENQSYRMADIGCGYGYWLERFEQWNSQSAQLYGIDLDAERIRSASRKLRQSSLVIGDARDLPWASHSFDLVCQFVVFTSVLHNHDRQPIAGEMLRVLKPGGCILWYDFFAPNPFNSHTRPIRRAQIATLFPDCRIMLRRVTLAPPIARLSLRVSRQLTEALDRLPFLQTHYLAIIRPSAAGA